MPSSDRRTDPYPVYQLLSVRKHTQFATPVINTHLGGPIATMPAGVLNLHGRPFGLSVMSLPKHDGVLFKIMSAWEATFPKRALPPLLPEQDTDL